MLNKQYVTIMVVLIMTLSGCATGPRPYDGLANSENIISTSLSNLAEEKKLLLTFGANWCSDSRELASAYQEEPLASLLNQQYDVVFIDVGRRDNNMLLAQNYQVPVMGGIPAIAVVNKAGELEFSSKATDLNNAEKMSAEEIFSYFEKLK